MVITLILHILPFSPLIIGEVPSTEEAVEAGSSFFSPLIIGEVPSTIRRPRPE